MMVISPLCFADNTTDLGTFGTVFPIQEKHIIEVLKAKMQSDEGKQLLAAMDAKIKQITETQHVVPTPVSNITPSPEHASFLFDPSISLKQDLTDHNGTRFYKQGDRVNPLDSMTLSKIYVFIDGDQPKQVAFAKQMYDQQNTVIILVKGDPITLMREQGLAVFFDQEGAMVNRFQLKHVPCSMHQEGKMLRITEWTEDELENSAMQVRSFPSEGRAP
jgi:conjugal transfer pilus assembly protein TraW